jgi:hypothetical protein
MTEWKYLNKIGRNIELLLLSSKIKIQQSILIRHLIFKLIFSFEHEHKNKKQFISADKTTNQRLIKHTKQTNKHESDKQTNKQTKAYIQTFDKLNIQTYDKSNMQANTNQTNTQIDIK